MAKDVKNKPVQQDEVLGYDADLSKRIGDQADTTKSVEDGEGNPELKEQGVHIGDTVQVGAESDTEPVSESLLSTLSQYVNVYPDNKIFHITSDGQVFLEKSISDALNHEKALGGKVKSHQVI